jgi:hypothetical protein
MQNIQEARPRLLELFPAMPVMGNLTLVIAVLSYAGQLNLTAAGHDYRIAVPSTRVASAPAVRPRD